jgi:hypothetical protein
MEHVLMMAYAKFEVRTPNSQNNWELAAPICIVGGLFVAVHSSILAKN